MDEITTPSMPAAPTPNPMPPVAPKSSSALKMVLLFAAVVLLSVLSWMVYKDLNSSEEPTATTTTTEQSDAAPTVDSSSDLDSAKTYLEGQDIDSDLDTTELDETLN